MIPSKHMRRGGRQMEQQRGTCGAHGQGDHVAGHAVEEEVAVDVQAVAHIQVLPQRDLLLAAHHHARAAHLPHALRPTSYSLHLKKETHNVRGGCLSAPCVRPYETMSTESIHTLPAQQGVVQVVSLVL